MQFLLDYLARFLVDNQERWKDQGVRVRWFGQRQHLPETVLTVLRNVEAATVDNMALNLQFCLNYGGRAEILDGAKAVARAAAAGTLDPDALDEQSFVQYLSDPEISRRRLVPAQLGGAPLVQLHALAGRLRRADVRGHAVARRRPPRPLPRCRAVRQARSQAWRRRRHGAHH